MIIICNFHASAHGTHCHCGGQSWLHLKRKFQLLINLASVCFSNMSRTPQRTTHGMPMKTIWESALCTFSSFTTNFAPQNAFLQPSSATTTKGHPWLQVLKQGAWSQKAQLYGSKYVLKGWNTWPQNEPLSTSYYSHTPLSCWHWRTT